MVLIRREIIARKQNLKIIYNNNYVSKTTFELRTHDYIHEMHYAV